MGSKCNLFLQKGGENILSDVAMVLLVGLDHHGNMDLDRFQDSITLEAEPHNPHDSEAIVAKVNSITVGHVCRSHTARVYILFISSQRLGFEKLEHRTSFYCLRNQF